MAEIFGIGLILGLIAGTVLGAKVSIVSKLIGRVSASPSCSFCELPSQQTYKLLGGVFNVHICDRCASLGHEVLRSRSAKENASTRLEFLAQGNFTRCSFCGKGSDDREMFVARHARMCANCSEFAQAALRTH